MDEDWMNEFLDHVEDRFYENLPKINRDLFPVKEAANSTLHVAMMTLIAEGLLVFPGDLTDEVREKQRKSAQEYMNFTKVVSDGRLYDLGT